VGTLNVFQFADLLFRLAISTTCAWFMAGDFSAVGITCPQAALCSAGLCLLFWYPTPPGSTSVEMWHTLRQYISELMTCVTRPACKRAAPVQSSDWIVSFHQTFVTSQIMSHGRRNNSDVCNSQLVQVAYETTFRISHTHEAQGEWRFGISAKDRRLKNNWNRSTT